MKKPQFHHLTINKEDNMKTHKHPYRKITANRGLFLRIGYAMAIALVILAFQWKGTKTEYHAIKEVMEEEQYVNLIATKIKMPEVITELPKENVLKTIEKVVIKVVEKPIKKEEPAVIFDPSKMVQPTIPNEKDVIGGEMELKTPYRVVEVFPKYIGGISEFFKHLVNEIKYPAQERSLGIEGTVHIEFVVRKDGSVGDIKVLRGVTANLNNEAIRAIQAVPAHWKAGIQAGKKVDVYFNIPVKFSLQ